MKNSNPIFSLKNFRSFGEEGADFELAPITVLTGCNSSGKSSLVKALMLLSRQSKLNKITPMSDFFLPDIFQNVTSNTFCNVSWNDLNITSSDLGLGKFDNMLNVSTKDETIKISYQIWSKYLQETVVVSRNYIRSHDILNNGVMTEFSIEKLDGTTIVSLNPYDLGGKDDVESDLKKVYEYYQRYTDSVKCAKVKMALDSIRCWLFELIGDVIIGKQYTWNLSSDCDNKRGTYEKLKECCNHIEISIIGWESFEERIGELEKSLKERYNAEYEKFEGNKNIIFRNQAHLNKADEIDKIINAIELNASHYTIGDLENELNHRFEIYNIKSDVTKSVGLFEEYPDEVYKVSDSALFISQMWDTEVSNHAIYPIDKSEYSGQDGVENVDFLDYLVEHNNPRLEWENSLMREERTEIIRYIQLIINEVSYPWFLQEVKYINSSTAIVNRIYSADASDKLSRSLIQYIDEGRDNAPVIVCDKNVPEDVKDRINFLNHWIKEFGICEEEDGGIDIKGATEGPGILLYVKRKDEEPRLLADEGYGITQLVALLLQIANSILLDSKKKPAKYICVEEPEIHLHPAYQSKLADMFVEAYQKYNIHFIIETHSEYLIRKLQVLVADKENKLSPNDVSLNYVDKGENGISTNRKIEILEDGRLSEPFGPGFFDEADSLAMDLMKYKVRR